MEIFYALKNNLKILTDDNIISVSSLYSKVELSDPSPEIIDAVSSLTDGFCSETEIDFKILNQNNYDNLARFYFFLSKLIQAQMIYVTTELDQDQKKPIAILEPISRYFQLKKPQLDKKKLYRLSRFLYLRKSDMGELILESPLSHAKIIILHRETLSLLYNINELIDKGFLSDHEMYLKFLALLIMGSFIDEIDPLEKLNNKQEETLLQWDFHDLLFHSRSRVGRHNNPVGGRFRFLGKIPPQPAIKKLTKWISTLSLPIPGLSQMYNEFSLEKAINDRISVRQLQPTPLSIVELGEFLYHCARVKSLYTVDDKGEFTKRPYPSGGASYELELYLLIENCIGVPKGFYWYDPINHAIYLISYPNENTNTMLIDAHLATAKLSWPQVLIVISARFQRVSWKYDAMAYSTILKNTGILYSSMYLIATAMGLGPCGVGLGNSDLFSLVAQTDYYEEGSVGEFILNGRQK